MPGAFDSNLSRRLVAALRFDAATFRRGLQRLALRELQLERAPMLQDLDRAIELHILLFLRLAALGAGALVALLVAGRRRGSHASRIVRLCLFFVLILPILEMMREVRFVDLRILVDLGALQLQRRERFFGWLYIQVRRDSDRLNRAPSRSVVARSGQPQRRMIVERQNR